MSEATSGALGGLRKMIAAVLARWQSLFGIFKGFITIPGAISLAGLGLAVVCLYIEFQWTSPDISFALGFGGATAETARAVLTIIATVSMGALGTIYSIVLVVYTLAAGNIGPRLLQRFSGDRVNQGAVGILGATFLFSLTVLNAVRTDQVPQLSVAVAMLLAMLSVLLLLLFVHSVARRVTIDEEVASIAASLDKQIDTAISQKAGAPLKKNEQPKGEHREFRSDTSGYVDRLDTSSVTKAARHADAFVEYHVRPGDYVLPDAPVATIYGNGDEKLDSAVRSSIVFGRTRTPEHDLRFSVNLLIEIALRALSPGINDTFTAVVCIDRLTTSMAWASEEGLSSGVFRDEDNVARVVIPRVAVADLIDTGIAPLRRASRDNVLMMRQIISALHRLAGRVEGENADAVARQLDLVIEEVKASKALEADRKAVIAHANAALKDVRAGTETCDRPS